MTGTLTFHGIDPTNQSAFVCGFAFAVQQYVDNYVIDWEAGDREARQWSRTEAFEAGFREGAAHYGVTRPETV
jgi:hypothetical protein